MKYPYIGELKSGSGGVVIFDSKDSGSQLNYSGEHWDKEDLHKHLSGVWVESQFKNITREYLSNTYGKIESKEHAEFIVELADGVDFINPTGSSFDGYPCWFCFDDNELYFFDDEHNANDCNEKLITIPLTPKKDNSDEWPKVGDLVQTNFGKGVVELLPDVKGCFVIQVNGNYLQLKRDELDKPKTPDEELRGKSIDDMSQQIRNKIPKISWGEAESIAADLYDFGYRKPQ